MTTRFQRQDLRERFDFDASNDLVAGALGRAMRNHASLLRFVARYASWNGYFGSGVAALAAKIGRSRELFRDRDEPIVALSDRSVLVASFFFDAARDEFDDSDTEHRDTHRCLAQATLRGILQYGRMTDTEKINAALADPTWLDGLQQRVAIGYGTHTPDTLPNIVRSIGYHLGSEVLADGEFSLIDEALDSGDPALVAYLRSTKIEVAGGEHLAYAWISKHSAHGCGANAECFDQAVMGLRRAFQFCDLAWHEELKEQVFLGFGDFSRDHALFFDRVNEP